MTRPVRISKALRTEHNPATIFSFVESIFGIKPNNKEDFAQNEAMNSPASLSVYGELPVLIGLQLFTQAEVRHTGLCEVDGVPMIHPTGF